MKATTARDEEVWNAMFSARHVSRSLSTSALAILTAYRIEIERSCKPAESAPAPREDAVSRAIDWARSRDDGDDSPARVLADAVDALRSQLAPGWDREQALADEVDPRPRMVSMEVTRCNMADSCKLLATERERAEVSRSLRDIDAANLRGANTRAEIANIRAEQAESELKELTRISDESDEHQTWNAYYVSELERRLTPEQIAAARVALHERWQTVPHVDEQFSVVARIQQAESALSDARKENERLRDALDTSTKACKGMLAISQLWIPTISDEEHRGEAEALHLARNGLLEAVEQRAAFSSPPSGQKDNT